MLHKGGRLAKSRGVRRTWSGCTRHASSSSGWKSDHHSMRCCEGRGGRARVMTRTATCQGGESGERRPPGSWRPHSCCSVRVKEVKVSVRFLSCPRGAGTATSGRGTWRQDEGAARMRLHSLGMSLAPHQGHASRGLAATASTICARSGVPAPATRRTAGDRPVSSTTSKRGHNQ